MIVDCVGPTVKTVQVTAWPGSRIFTLSLIDNYLKAEGRSTWREEPWREESQYSSPFVNVQIKVLEDLRHVESLLITPLSPQHQAGTALR